MSGESEALRCENCGQAVLASDIECWHCGAPLAKLKIDLPSPDEEQEGKESGIGGPTLHVIFYAIMTAVIALALVLVIRSLGQQPRLAAGFTTGDDLMMELVAPDGSFSVELPAGLIWYFPLSDRGQSAEAAQMAGDPQFESALQPLFGLASDAEILLTARVDSGILAVARSERLGQLTVENVVGSLGSEDFPGSTVLATQKGVSSAGTTAAIITIEQEDPHVICRQYFLPDSTGAFLAAICSSRAQFEQQSTDFDAILSSVKMR